MTTDRPLRRPKSTIFVTAEDKMKRFTSLFVGASDSKCNASLPPPIPKVLDSKKGNNPYGSHPLNNRHKATNSLSIPSPPIATVANASTPNLTQYADNTLAPPTISNMLTPTVQELPPPPPMAPFAAGSSSRPGSRASMVSKGSRPGTPSGIGFSSGFGQPAEISRLHKKRKRFGRKKMNETTLVWQLTSDSTESLDSYDFGPLIRGEPAKDLWYQDGDTLVYLTAKDSPNPKYTSPVFRLHSTPLMFASLGHCIENVNSVDQPLQCDRNGNLAPDGLFLAVPVVGQTTPDVQGESVEIDMDKIGIMHKVYFPVLELDAPKPAAPKKKKNQPSYTKEDAEDTLQHFVDARNLFAFLSQSFLVASQNKEIPFDILSKIHAQLGLSDAEAYPNDMNASGKIFMAENHLQVYIDNLRLDDIRNDDDAIVEALVLGEKWRSLRLYQEGFIHASGRLKELKTHPGMSLVSPQTRSRLDRASLDLYNVRINNVVTRIPNFEFPAVWIGVGRGKEPRKWRVGYEQMRTLVLNHMKSVFGAWPPRAGRHGKAGGFSETGGLNRVVLKRLYDDLTYVYDMTVDREWIHGERIHFDTTNGSDSGDEDTKAKFEDARITMRKIMEEFDTSNVPVQPEMPFCLPRLPHRLPSSRKKKKRGLFSRSGKKVAADEIAELFNHSYNQDAVEEFAENGLVKAFKQMEREYGIGKTIEDSMDARRGRWIFMYCVLQSLPMVVVDAVGLAYGDGCEYFMCENLKGSLPWEKGPNKRYTRLSGMWAAAPDGSMMGPGGVSMANLSVNPDDEIETTFRRSHCWGVAELWRLVHDPDAKSEQLSELERIIGYDHEGRPIYADEYIPGQVVPGSPPRGQPAQYDREYAAYADKTVASDMERLQLEESRGIIYENSQSPGPAWAQEARASYTHPQYHHAGERVVSPSEHPSSIASWSISPTDSTDAQFQIQPFEFDLTPLNVPPQQTSVGVPPQLQPDNLSKVRISPPGSVKSTMRQSSLPGSPAYASPTYSNPRKSPAPSPRASPGLHGRQSPKWVNTLSTHSPITMSPLQMSPSGSPRLEPVEEVPPVGTGPRLTGTV